MGASKSPDPSTGAAPNEPMNNGSPEDSLDKLDFSNDAQEPNSNKDSGDLPFDKEPFEAGVEADENSDPKKFIEQLTGKLGQSLRKYTQTQGGPDFELEKFAVNSLLSATHTGEMDGKDQKEIIKKVQGSGKEGEESSTSNQDTSQDDTGETPEDNNTTFDTGEASDDSVDETLIDEMSLNDYKSKTLIKLYDMGDDKVKQILTRLVSFSDQANRKAFIEDLKDEIDNDDANEIFAKLNKLGVEIPKEEEELVYETSLFLKNPPKNNMFQEGSNDILEDTPCSKGYKQDGMMEQEGKQVPKCVKIKENLESNNTNGIFVDKAVIKAKLNESFNQDDMETPIVKPITKPKVTPTTPVKPSRKNKPFLPNVTPGIKTQPKAISENDGVYHKTFSSAVQLAKSTAENKGYTINDDEWFNKVSTGPKKPSDGKTNRYSIELFKGTKLQRKQLHIQVYNTGYNYELNFYIV